jgi:Zn-dependent M16 (insulinase) family peptidase
MGAAGQSYEQIAERRAACTGGLWASPTAMRHATDDARSCEIVRMGLKTLDREADAAFALLSDLVMGVEASDRERIEEIYAQTIASVRTRLVNDGLGTARSAAGRGLSPEIRRGHDWMSPEVLRRVEEEAKDMDAARNVAQTVETLREALKTRARWTLSFTGSDVAYAALRRMLEKWEAQMRSEAVPQSTVEIDRTLVYEGLAGPMNVAYCARVLPGLPTGDTRLPLVKLGLYLAGFDYFLPGIRLKGNAYGAGANYDDATGTCQMYSYRDPHIAPTLGVFDGLLDWARARDWNQGDIDRAIIGSAKDAEKPIRPADATMTALIRKVRGDSDDRRDRDYNIKLGATPESVQSALVAFLESGGTGSTAVASSREKLDAANALLPTPLQISDILP